MLPAQHGMGRGANVVAGARRPNADVEIRRLTRDRVSDLANRYKEAQEELGRIKKALADAIASVHGLKDQRRDLRDDKQSLSEKVADLIEAYRVSRSVSGRRRIGRLKRLGTRSLTATRSRWYAG